MPSRRLTSLAGSALGVFAFACVTPRSLVGQTPPDTTRKVIDLGRVHVGPGVVLVDRKPPLTGASAAVLDSTTLIAPGSRTLSELLAARLPGVSVLQSSGVLGTGSRVRLRGGSNFISRREPLLIIDGTRVDGNQTSATFDIGGQSPSRLDDIDVDQVERVEILRGPAAAAMYGADAAGGVIRITTRTPNAAAALRFHVEGGAEMDATEYPANFSTGNGVAGDATCARYQQVAGTCTPSPLLSWNPLEQASPFRTGSHVRVGGSATGALTQRLRYAVTGSVHDASGILAPNHARRYTGGVNLDTKPLPQVDVSVRSAYFASETEFPLSQSVLLAGLGGNAIDDPTNRGYTLGPMGGLDLVRQLHTDQDIRRFTGSVSASWRPARWVGITALAGYGSVHRNEDQASPIIFQFETPPNLFRLGSGTERTDRTNLNGSATFNYPIVASVTGETNVGIEWLNRSFRNSQLVRLSDGSAGSRSSSTLQSRVNGLSATERLVWQRRRSIGFGIRRDRLSLGFDPATYRTLDAAWTVSEEPFFPTTRALGELRLRAAYGRTTDTRALLGGVFIFTPSIPGMPAPAAERDGEHVSEVEAGFDARLFGRIAVDATWYRQRSSDALAPSGFGNGLVETAGAWRMTGVDASVSADLVNTLHTEWTARLTASTLSSRVERYAADLGASRGLPIPGARTLIVPGRPIAGIWSHQLRARDADGDGIITPNEVMISDDSVYLGSPIPTREIGLSSSFTHRRVRLDALLDYRGGFRQFNLTEAFRCEVEVCGTLYLPNASAGDQARVVSLPRGYNGFVEDGSFLRLREVAVTWTILPGWTWRHGFQKLTLTAAGRNLLTSTGYSGLDPEVNASGQSTFGSMEFGTLPLPRTFLVRLDIAR